MPDESESIALRSTVIDGNGYPDDYQVIWRGLPIGRIMKGTGSPNHPPQWWWGCNVYGIPGGSGTGIDLNDCKVAFKAAWLRIRADFTPSEIARAHRHAMALARYDRKKSGGGNAPPETRTAKPG
jgi:hypothetical protein